MKELMIYFIIPGNEKNPLRERELIPRKIFSIILINIANLVLPLIRQS
jgi:hypothetical protein